MVEVFWDGDCFVVFIFSKFLVWRCFFVIYVYKGVLMVGNEMIYEDGYGFWKNVIDLVEGVKKVNGVLEVW